MEEVNKVAVSTGFPPPVLSGSGSGVLSQPIKKKDTPNRYLKVARIGDLFQDHKKCFIFK